MTPPQPESLAVYVVRNEVDPDCEYHCDALAARFPTATEVDFVAGERPPDDADAVVLTGSTAGVYETDRHGWIAEQEALVRDLVEREVPTLGVCFGHQVVNAALGGTVEHVGTNATAPGGANATVTFNLTNENVSDLAFVLNVTTPENVSVVSHTDDGGTWSDNRTAWTYQAIQSERPFSQR